MKFTQSEEDYLNARAGEGWANVYSDEEAERLIEERRSQIETDEILADPETMARLAEAEQDIANGNVESLEDLTVAMERRAQGAMKFYNVNEDGEVYGEHDNQSDAEAIQQQFPSDTVVEASSPEEAARLAWPQKPEEELTVQEIVELSPTMAAMAAELRDTSDSWLHTSVDPDSEVDFEKAALIAYQAMVKYPPRTQNQLLLWVLSVLPEATFGEDQDGQILIYTNLTEVDENGNRTNPRLTDMEPT